MGYWGLVLRFVLFATPVAVLVIASYRYVKSYKSTDSKLLFLGSTTTFIAYTFSTFFFYFYEPSNYNLSVFGWITGIISILGIIGIFVFAIGFLMLIKNHIKLKKIEINDEVDEIGKS